MIDSIIEFLTDPETLIAQGSGVAAFALFVLSFQWLNPRYSVLQQAVGNGVFAFHFYMLGQEFFIYIALIAMARDLCVALGADKHQKAMLSVYLLFLLGGAALMAGQLLEYLGVIGSCANTLAQVFRNRFYAYRGLSFVHQVFWLTAHTMIGSIPGSIFMSWTVMSNAVGVVRYYLRNL